MKLVQKTTTYNSPRILLSLVLLDETVANASSTITFGEINEEYQPDVQDWISETNHSNHEL